MISKKAKEQNENKFPLSRTKWVQGSRRLAREKILQFIYAFQISQLEFELLFDHIFFRKFNISEESADKNSPRLLTPDEIYELEADIPIQWNDDDVIFARNLINRVLENNEKFDQYIKEHTDNWELERIARIDRILMHIALAEILFFDDIPYKVSVNEAIDIAKKFSTEKSSQFINGILDAIYNTLLKEKKISKNKIFE